METAIGIDLGTTFSAVSVIDEFGKPILVKNALGESLTPSVIFFESTDSTVVGSEAKEMQALGESNVASFFKRNMGDVNFELNFHGKSFSATDLSAILLKKLKDDAEATLNCKIGKAVVTVPAYFDDLQKKATIKAAEKAGLEVLRIINEPTAAAIAFGVTQSKNQTILVYDLGGGTFDVTILKIEDDTIRVIATGGDHELGGKDWDNRLIGYFAAQFKNEFGEDPLDDAVSFNDLLVRAENVKKQLSSSQTSKFYIVFGGNRGNYEIARTKFEEITQDLLQRTTSKAEEILQEANLTWEQLDGVLLVGGSTRMPMIVNWVEQMSGKPPIKGINVDEAVCLGAAIQANIELSKSGAAPIFSLGGKMKIEDVMSHSLGLIAENSDRSRYINSIIIPKNKRIPASEVRPYQIRTGKRGQNELEIYLTQGETEIVGECKIIGKYVFSDIEYVASEISVIDVEYQYDENGTVQIAATQRETDKKLSMTEVPLPADMSWIDRAPEQIQETVVPHISVVIAVDLSGSMSGHPLAEAQKAAKGFVEKLDLSNASVALMPFADRVEENPELTQNAKKLTNGINQWSSMMDSGTVGWGNSTHPFDESLKLLKKQDNPRFIIVLADGVWSYQDRAIASAKKCAAEGIEIIAIGFGSADKKFLQAIATSDENALFTNLESLVSSFSKIAQVLTETGGNYKLGHK